MRLKVMRNNAKLLFIWFAMIRWIMLSLSNAEAQKWGADPVGNTMAILITVYLLYVMFANKPQLNNIFFGVTLGLVGYNLWCLYTMTKIFIADFSPINFGYEMLDINILSFFVIVAIRCKMTIRNTNEDSFLNVPIL
jgi:hypothetical protein